MKNWLNLFSILFIAISLQSCFDFDNEYDNTEEIQFAKGIMALLKSGDKESLEALFHPNFKSKVSEVQLKGIIDNGAKVLNEASLPVDSLIQASNYIKYGIAGKTEIVSLSFPFQLRSDEVKDSTVFINVGLSEDKIIGLNVGQSIFNKPIARVETGEPHLDSHSISFDAIDWFRIWYGSGYAENDYGDKYGYYAVSGGRRQLTLLNIESELAELFNLINDAIPDSTDYKSIRERLDFSPEYIYLRFKLDQPPYNRIGEFSIEYNLTDESEKPDPMSKYISIKHSGNVRYLYLVKDNPEMVKLLRSIAYKRYDDYFETRWM